MPQIFNHEFSNLKSQKLKSQITRVGGMSRRLEMFNVIMNIIIDIIISVITNSISNIKLGVRRVQEGVKLQTG